MATLKQFLQTGELGPIHPGMSETEVIALLGPPQDESVARHPQILKYGGLQLTFLRHSEAAARRLAHVGLYFRPRAEPIPEPTLLADFTPTADTTIAEVREFLGRAGLKESAVVEGEDTNYLILPSGARITFDGQKLQSVHFATRTPNPAKKQISVSISKDTWNQLRTLARQSNRSVSELCAEWITQRANELQHDNARGVGNRG
ncbi:MAG TPA: hypothetical protein VG013_08500 [Gemmataceae bacterium]|jgi:hypothetical protein|nr:hypothetical protein [Gemmataceae bacterium]